MKHWVTFPRTEGTHSRQAHCDLPNESFEREFGREGFFGPATHLYHKHPPTSWVKWEGDLRPQAYDLSTLRTAQPMPWDATPVMHNAHMRLRIWHTSGKMEQLASNADGDEMLFIHAGSGEFYCDFGHMSFREGDYILIPRAAIWRIECHEPCTILLIEATNNGYSLPEKSVVGPHAIFDPAILDVPKMDEAFRSQQTENEWQVSIKRGSSFATVTYPYNPLDAIGWKGDNLVVRVNWRDIRPLMSARYHLPPSAHTTFLTQRFVICTFCPRPFESDPGALKVPFYHSNNDYDEIIFYHMGEFFSRDNIHPGMLTLHPCGFPHGPHPKAFAAGAKHAKTATDEVAVMIDTRDLVTVDAAIAELEWKDYVNSWKAK